MYIKIVETQKIYRSSTKTFLERTIRKTFIKDFPSYYDARVWCIEQNQKEMFTKHDISFEPLDEEVKYEPTDVFGPPKPYTVKMSFTCMIGIHSWSVFNDDDLQYTRCDKCNKKKYSMRNV